MVHILVSPKDKFAVYIFSTLDYPQRLAYKVLHKTLELFENNVGQGWKDQPGDKDFKISSIESLFQEFKTGSMDQLTIAQNNVEEVQEVLVHNMKELLERQGQVDVLVDKSEDLKFQTKLFFKKTEKIANPCCTLI